MSTRFRKITLLAATAAVGAASITGAFAASETGTFTASATTVESLSVTCGVNLRFGTIGVHSANTVAVISVAAASGETASSDAPTQAYPATSDSGPGECAVTKESGGDATASLSAATGTWDVPTKTLNGVSLKHSVTATNTLSANIELSKATAIGNETVYIGGDLTIPAGHTAYGSYSETITITVTD